MNQWFDLLFQLWQGRKTQHLLDQLELSGNQRLVSQADESFSNKQQLHVILCLHSQLYPRSFDIIQDMMGCMFEFWFKNYVHMRWNVCLLGKNNQYFQCMVWII